MAKAEFDSMSTMHTLVLDAEEALLVIDLLGRIARCNESTIDLDRVAEATGLGRPTMAQIAAEIGDALGRAVELEETSED